MIDRNLSDRADAFIKKYYNDEYITDHQKAEALSRNRPDGKNILTVLGEAISDYENSKPFSAAGEPSFGSLMLLLDLMNQVLFNGVLVHKGSQSASTKSGKSFKDEVKDFLAKICELSNYNTKTPVDAFEAGAKLNLDEGKTEQMVNYSLEKEWIREPDRTFDRVATADPPPSRKFRFIFITSKGIDKQYEEEHEYAALPSNPHIGDIITTNIHHAEQSPIQIGKGSTQNVVFSDGQIEELRKILARIEQTTRDKGSEIPSDKRSEVELDVREINQEIVKPKGDRDNSKILTKVRSLGDKIKDLAPYVGLAAQISGWVFSLSN